MPVHSQVTFKQYGFGVGCNTMEGREQKHQKVAKYQKHATYHSRWFKSFQHEAVELMYLRLNGHDRKVYHKKSRNYIPVKANGCSTCQGPRNSFGNCSLCNHTLNKDIDAEIEMVPQKSVSAEDSVSVLQAESIPRRKGNGKVRSNGRVSR